MNVDTEGELTGAAREVAMRAERTIMAGEKKRIVCLAERMKGDPWWCVPGGTCAFYSVGASVRHTRHFYPWEIESPVTLPAVTPKLERKTSHKMVRNSKTYTWVTVWSVVCLPIILWDACYVFFRSVIFCFSLFFFFFFDGSSFHSPRSMVGGDLHWIWTGYEIYQEVDYVRAFVSLGRSPRPPGPPLTPLGIRLRFMA